MKDELRYKFKIKRKYFQYARREVADGAISDIVMQAFDKYKSFFVYYSYGSEADTHAIIARLLAEGKEVYLPRVNGQVIEAVRFYGNEEELIKSPLGIREPTGQAYEGEIEVALVPLLCVNPNGYRLGYGGGYYDRFLAAHPQTIKAGLGYYLQLTDENFQEEHDVPLDLMVTERGIIDFGR
ncbi:MAG: 5-formyltetrahydrofolate cyclo-ligase [Clostridia bacterium]|nr:5-formyltetrahydrofolate cyclo-ligase [Clostridia bacterium]